jgi:hypothetical protein
MSIIWMHEKHRQTIYQQEVVWRTFKRYITQQQARDENTRTPALDEQSYIVFYMITNVKWNH